MAIPEERPVVPSAEYDEELSFERLQEYPFFAEVPDKVLKPLQKNIAERHYGPGDVILKMGDFGDAAYFIGDGAVEVRLATPDAETPEAPEPERPGLLERLRRAIRGHSEAPRPAHGLTPDGTVVLADMPVEVKPGESVRLEAGEFFGEMSAMSRFPISADVVAVEETRCLLIATAALRIMFKRPQFKDLKAEIDERYRERTLATHLGRMDLFSDLDRKTLETLKDRAELESFEPGEVIVEEGEPVEALYLVRGGFVKVGADAGGGELAVTYLRKGDHAGEVGLLLDEPWPYTLRALEHVEMVRLAREDVDELVVSSHPAVEGQLWSAAVEGLKERGFAKRNPLATQHMQMAMDTGLIHGESVLMIDGTVCTRCDDCVRGCAATHGGAPKFIREGLQYRNWTVPTACYQCTDPVCMIGCPTGAITRPVGTPEVLIDPVTCIGCGQCDRRCPWDNIVSVPYDHPDLGRQINLATKCDQCFGREEGPACVQQCPHGAAIRISFKDLETVAFRLGDRGATPGGLE